MSFDDYASVEVDDAGYFYIIKDNGTVYRYRIDREEDLLQRILDSNEVDVYMLNREGERERENDGEEYYDEY